MDASRGIGPIPFMKMHGLGNDFVVVDARRMEFTVSPEAARRIADRHRGVGFDQLAIIEPGDSEVAATLSFLNADGSPSATCGNATRCIARHLMEESGVTALRLRTERGILAAEDAGAGLTRVNLGPPILEWDAIPLAEDVDPLHLPIDGDPVATGMGNPHCTFLVENIEAVDLEALGPTFEHHPLFPERTNVEFAEVKETGTLRVRVWERGTGVTLASGSCASAAAVAAMRRDRVEGPVRVILDGGPLEIDWRTDGVWMTGPTVTVFTGELTSDFLGAL
ncbi:MAG: diaminopimelate epimerase [Pseudomonadota bacterium]